MCTATLAVGAAAVAVTIKVRIAYVAFANGKKATTSTRPSRIQFTAGKNKAVNSVKCSGALIEFILLSKDLWPCKDSPSDGTLPLFHLGLCILQLCLGVFILFLGLFC